MSCFACFSSTNQQPQKVQHANLTEAHTSPGAVLLFCYAQGHRLGKLYSQAQQTSNAAQPPKQTSSVAQPQKQTAPQQQPQQQSRPQAPTAQAKPEAAERPPPGAQNEPQYQKYKKVSPGKQPVVKQQSFVKASTRKDTPAFLAIPSLLKPKAGNEHGSIVNGRDEGTSDAYFLIS